MYIEGKIKTGKKTKELVKYLDKWDIALINHNDIDELAALSILNTGVRCVLNTGCCMTGRYESKGTSILIRNGVLLYDIALSFDLFNDNDRISIANKDIVIEGKGIHYNVCTPVNEEYIILKTEKSRKNAKSELNAFIDNTITHALRDKEYLLSDNYYPDLNTELFNKHVLVVARGAGCENQLLMIKDYIKYQNPVIIGVDGGADILLNFGLIPDILIGDMDSVSDIGIYKSREIILHAYSSGYCPCLERIEKMNVKYKLLPMPGTSEDIALLLAYDMGAELITLVGGHACMEDFLEKGRNGMGSTLLTRIKVGNKLVDVKGISKLLPVFSLNSSIYGGSTTSYESECYKERDRLCMKM
ncbi:MAG: putative cytokinetic ring protein SteA [Bacillota bacterium]